MLFAERGHGNGVQAVVESGVVIGGRSDFRLADRHDWHAVGYGIPADRMPIVTVSQSEITPATYNDPALDDRLHAVAVAALGKEHVDDAQAVMGSEDVGLFSLDGKIPAIMYWLGAMDPAKLAHAKETGVALSLIH